MPPALNNLYKWEEMLFALLFKTNLTQRQGKLFFYLVSSVKSDVITLVRLEEVIS